MINQATQLLRRFLRAREGAAIVEFALIMPMMLLLYVGSMEGSAAISMDRRVQNIAGSLGDLVARTNGTIAVASLENYFQAAQGIMTPFPTTSLIQVATSVYVKPDGTTNVVWSRQYTGTTMTSTGGKTRTVGQPMPLPTAMTNISRDGYVIVSEAYYTFTPVSKLVFKATIPLYRENFYVPRFGSEIKIGS